MATTTSSTPTGNARRPPTARQTATPLSVSSRAVFASAANTTVSDTAAPSVAGASLRPDSSVILLNNRKLSRALNERCIELRILRSEKVQMQQELLHKCEDIATLHAELDCVRGVLQRLCASLTAPLRLSSQLHATLASAQQHASDLLLLSPSGKSATHKRRRSAASQQCAGGGGGGGDSDSELARPLRRRTMHNGVECGVPPTADDLDVTRSSRKRRKLHRVLPSVSGYVISHPSIVLSRVSTRHSADNNDIINNNINTNFIETDSRRTTAHNNNNDTDSPLEDNDIDEVDEVEDEYDLDVEDDDIVAGNYAGIVDSPPPQPAPPLRGGRRPRRRSSEEPLAGDVVASSIAAEAVSLQPFSVGTSDCRCRRTSGVMAPAVTRRHAELNDTSVEPVCQRSVGRASTDNQASVADTSLYGRTDVNETCADNTVIERRVRVPTPAAAVDSAGLLLDSTVTVDDSACVAVSTYPAATVAASCCTSADGRDTTLCGDEQPSVLFAKQRPALIDCNMAASELHNGTTNAADHSLCRPCVAVDTSQDNTLIERRAMRPAVSATDVVLDDSEVPFVVDEPPGSDRLNCSAANSSGNTAAAVPSSPRRQLSTARAVATATDIRSTPTPSLSLSPSGVHDNKTLGCPEWMRGIDPLEGPSCKVWHSCPTRGRKKGRPSRANSSAAQSDGPTKARRRRMYRACRMQPELRLTRIKLMDVVSKRGKRRKTQSLGASGDVVQCDKRQRRSTSNIE